MSRTTAKGTKLETDLVNHFQELSKIREPAIDWDTSVFAFHRTRSKGKDDAGDVIGPATMIEAKNYRNPVIGSLLGNAEWKAKNAKRPIWCLCWKTAGNGWVKRDAWGIATTVEAFNSWVDKPLSEEREREEYYLSAPTIDLGRGVPFSTVDDAMGFAVYDRRHIGGGSSGDTIRSSIYSMYTSDDFHVPAILFPRRDATGQFIEFNRWIVTMQLGGFTRFLDSRGIIPHDNDAQQEQ